MKYYELDFSDHIVAKDLRRLVNQIWKLLPMRENNEDWRKQLDSILVEIRGLDLMFGDQLSLLLILSKLEGLKMADNFSIYRATVFSVLTSVTELVKVLNARKS